MCFYQIPCFFFLSQHSRSVPPALTGGEVHDELQSGRRRLPGRGRHAGYLQTDGRRPAGEQELSPCSSGSSMSFYQTSSLVPAARDAPVRRRLDGGREGGISDPLPLGQVWRKPRGPGDVQRAGGPGQQVRRLLLPAQWYGLQPASFS